MLDNYLLNTNKTAFFFISNRRTVKMLTNTWDEVVAGAFDVHTAQQKPRAARQMGLSARQMSLSARQMGLSARQMGLSARQMSLHAAAE